MTLPLDELEKLAKALKAGKWVDGYSPRQHIDACSEDTVLALIAEVRRKDIQENRGYVMALEKKCARLREENYKHTVTISESLGVTLKLQKENQQLKEITRRAQTVIGYTIDSVDLEGRHIFILLKDMYLEIEDVLK